MKIKTITILILAWNGFAFELPAQSREIDLYKRAYDYLNDSIIKTSYPDVNTFAKNCNECCVKGITLSFDPNLQVASRFIENKRGFPLMDLAKKKYSLSSECIRSLRMDSRDCDVASKIQDSLKSFWSDYKMKKSRDISKSLDGLLSGRKDGFQVFFSDIYKNTLAAELKEFCLPFDSTIWMGHSTSYYFVFDDKGDIKDVFSGVSIHYN